MTQRPCRVARANMHTFWDGLRYIPHSRTGRYAHFQALPLRSRMQPGVQTLIKFVGHVRPQTVLKHGWPQLSLAALQQYAMSAMPTTDCQYMLMSLMLLASAPMALVRSLFWRPPAFSVGWMLAG